MIISLNQCQKWTLIDGGQTLSPINYNLLLNLCDSLRGMDVTALKMGRNSEHI